MLIQMLDYLGLQRRLRPQDLLELSEFLVVDVGNGQVMDPVEVVVLKELIFVIEVFEDHQHLHHFFGLSLEKGEISHRITFLPRGSGRSRQGT